MSFKIKLDLLKDCDLLPVNCRISSGECVPALSSVHYAGRVPAGVIFACHAESAERFFLCTQNEVYVSGNGEDFISLYPLAGNSPFAVEEISNGEARAVIISGNKAVAHTEDSFTGFSIGAELSCGAMHCGRLFGADAEDKFLLRWSGGGGVRDWKQGLYGGGSLKLDPERGGILNLVNYRDKLVAVREYGLTALSTFGSPENFSVEITDTDTDRIYKNTAKVAGGNLLFFTASGLRSFDGAVIRNIEHRLSGDISLPECAVALADRYYLSCRSESLNARAVMCYDVSDGESYLIDIAADGLCTAGAVYAYNSSGTHRLEAGGGYNLTVGEFDFGTDRAKTLKEIYLNCAGADAEISNGRVTRKFKNAGGILKPNLRGKYFTVKVTGSNPVYSLTATAEALNGI